MKLRVRETFDVPIIEVSGLCTVPVASVEHVMLVGDSDTTIAWAPWNDGAPGAWQTLTVADLPGCPPDAGQFEAVAAAGDGRIVIMAEEPALLIEVDLRRGVCSGWWRLDVSSDRRLAKKWNADDNSRGEALVLGSDGHVLVVKEKDPVLSIVFGPDSEPREPTWGVPTWDGPDTHALVAQTWGPVAGAPGDVSDAMLWDGALWLLSDQDRSLSATSATSGGWSVTETHPLDKSVTKPEGVIVTGDGTLLVAMDSRKREGTLVSVDRPT